MSGSRYKFKKRNTLKLKGYFRIKIPLLIEKEHSYATQTITLHMCEGKKLEESQHPGGRLAGCALRKVLASMQKGLADFPEAF